MRTTRDWVLDGEPVLVGRDRELAVVRGLLDRAPERGSALVLLGEPGIGKSVLLTEAARYARERGMRVLTTTGVRSEANVPFAGLHQLLRPLLGSVDELAPMQRDAMRSAFGMSDLAAPDLFRIALAALDLLADGAMRAPLLLVAEDAHWLDRSTTDVLAFVARRLEADPIVLLIASREGTERAFDNAGVPELRLEGLDDASAAELLDAVAPDLSPPMRARLLAEAAGNPLALVELPTGLERLDDNSSVRDWLPLTARLEHAFAARVSELPTEARTLLLVAAINDGVALTETFDAASLVAGTRMGVQELAPAISEGLVVVDERSIRFRHPLVRSAIHQAADLEQRHAAHAALGAAVSDDPDRRIWHQAASTVGPDPDLADELEAAALRAQRRGALGAAAAGLEEAARLTRPRDAGPRLLRAAGLALELGRRDMVMRLVHQADALDLSVVDRGRMAWIVETLDPGITGDPSTVLALVAAADRVRSHGDVELALNLLSAAASNSFWANRCEETHDEIVAAAERVPADPDDPRLLSILANAASVEEVAGLVARLSRLLPDREVDPTRMQLLGNAAFSLSVHDLATGFLSASIDTLRDQGRLVQLAQSLVMRAWSEIHLGRWTVAALDAEEGARLAHETAQPIWEAGAQVAQAMLAGLRGEDDVAEALAAAAERVVVPAGGRAVVAVVQLTRGVTALGAGRHGDAYVHLMRMLDPADLAHHRMTFSWAVGNLAEAACQIDRRDEARAIVDGLDSRAAQTPSPVFHQAMRRARLLLADDIDAEALFRTAIEGEATGGAFERARLQLDFGLWLRRQRRVVESREPLRVSRDTFDALGAIPWSERARQELRASGERSRGRAPDVLEQLTPQELQVAQMAAGGLSNREIGQKLYLSHRTAGSHLYRIFPKLDITSRADLSAALERTSVAVA